MATKTVINSNATRGVSILIDQAQQQQQQQQQLASGQQLSHATAKINISPAAVTTYAASTTSTTSSAYSSLGSSNNDMPSAMATNNHNHNNNNNNNYTTTFIDINCNDEDADNAQNFGTGLEPKKSITTTIPQLLLRVVAATETSQDQIGGSSNNNGAEATIIDTQLSERRKTKVNDVTGEEKPKNGQRVHVVGDGVGAVDHAVGISITREHRHSNNQHCTVGQQVKLVDNDVVTTSQPTTSTIIECNSIQVAVPVNDVNVAAQQKLAHHDHRNAEQHVQRNVDHHAKNDYEEAHNELVESCFGAHVGVSEHTVFAVTSSDGIAAAAVGIGGYSPPAATSLSHWQPEQLGDVVEAADCASALTETVEASAVKGSHVVKIKISPNSISNDNKSAVETLTKNYKENENFVKSCSNFKSAENNSEKTKTVSVVQLQESATVAQSLSKTDNNLSKTETLKLKINSEMVQKPSSTAGPTATSASTSSGNTTVTELNVSNASSYLYYMMSSGQFSPCDTLDSGTGSDLESNGNHNGNHSNSSPPPKLSPKLAAGINGSGTNKLELHLKTTKLRVHGMTAENKHHHHRPLDADAAGEHQRAGSLTDSEESESSLSCDSMNSSEYLRHSPAQEHMVPKPPPAPTGVPPCKTLGSFLPDSLLRDIRDRKFPTNDFVSKYVVDNNNSPLYDTIEESMELLNGVGAAIDSDQESLASHVKYVRERNSTNAPKTQRGSLPNKTFIINAADGTFVDTKMNSMPRKYEEDKYYDFHVNEHDNFRSFSLGGGSDMGDTCSEAGSWMDYEPKSQHEDAFAGYKDIRCSSGASTIRSSKGTVRGVKNRVRNGIATFLQLQQPNVKNFKEKDFGKVVLYTTSMGIIRDTYAKCSNVKQILRTLLVKFEERDVFMSVEYQQEIKERMHSEAIKVPQLFVEGQHIGDAEAVERLNESGELRQLLKPYKSIATTYTCQTCGGYRLLPCPSCNGSKKSVHRNHFTAEFVALKCMNCDEVGLVKCHNC